MRRSGDPTTPDKPTVLFRRKRPSESASGSSPTPVLQRGADGLSEVLLHLADGLVVSDDCGLPLLPDRGGVSVRRAADPAHLLGILCGQSLAGLRAVGITTDASPLSSALEPPARHLPLSLHLLRSGTSALQTIAAAEIQNGRLVAVPGTAQESIDFALIAQRVAELGLAPASVVHDQDRLLSALQPTQNPSSEQIRRFLGSADDEISAPTPAQEMLFGETRRRIPRLFSRFQPIGIGPRPAGSAESLAESSYRNFVLDHLPQLLVQALAEFQQTFGRTVRTIDVWGSRDAPFAVVATGPDAYAAREAAAAWKSSGGPSICVLRLPFMSPFPGDVLSGLLQGKRAVAVLESNGSGIGSALASHVRHAMACSLENGRADQKTLPFPDHAVYLSADSVPRLEFISLPLAEPAARLDALEAGLSDVTGTTRATVHGRAGAARPTSPHAERHRQVLARSYPSLPVSEAPRASAPAVGWVACGTLGEEAEELLDRCVRSYAAVTAGVVRTERFDLGDGALLSAFVGSGQSGYSPGGRVAVGIAGSAWAVRRPELWNSVQDGGMVIALMQDPVADFWARTSPELRRSVAERRIRLMALDVPQTVAPSLNPLERLIVLTGSLVAVLPDMQPGDRSAWRDRMIGELGRDVSVRARYAELLTGGFDQAASAKGSSPPDDLPSVAAPDAPRPARRRQSAHLPVLDPVQHWNLYLSRVRDSLPVSQGPDPALAFSVVPATGVSCAPPRGMSRDLPHWIPESCSACGRCWAFCPESAIGVFAVSFGEALAHALARAEESGADVFPVRRLEKALAAQAQRIIKADDLGQHRALGSALDEAYRFLSERIDASDEERGRTETGLAVVRSLLGDVPFRRVDTLFGDAEKREKGSGRVLSLTIDPDSCTSCGICMAECPDAAIESRPARPDHIAAVAPVLDLLEGLRASSVPPADLALPTPELASFLAESVAQSFRGGDDTTPGSGSRIAMRMALAGVIPARSAGARDRLNDTKELADRLENRIRSTLAEPFQVNDLEEFAARLGTSGPAQLDAASLAALVGGGGKTGPDTAYVRRLIDTLQALRTVVDGEKRLEGEFGVAGTLLGIAVDGPLARLYRFPSNPHPFPWLFLERGDALGPALSGVLEGRMREAVDRARLLRRAKFMADGSYDAARHEPDLLALFWPALSESERAYVPATVLVTDQEETLIPVVRDRLPITVILLSRRPVHLFEAGSAGNPAGGRICLPQPAVEALLEPQLFVAQTSISRPEHLIRCVSEAVATEGPALVHIFTPEPSISGFAPADTVAHAEAAVSSRVFPLFVRRMGAADRSALLLDLSGNPEPDQAWVPRSSLGLPSIALRGVEAPITPADWAVDEGSLAALFRRVPRSEADALVSVTEGLRKVASDETDVRTAAVSLRPDRSEIRYEVAPEMLDAVRRIGETWSLLLELSGAAENPAVLRLEELTSRLEKERTESEAAIRDEYEAQLAALEADQGDRFRSRLIERLRRLTGLSGGANGLRVSAGSGPSAEKGEEASS